MIWLIRLCMLPTLTPGNAGDAGFLGPIRAPTQKADMGSRARARGPNKKQPKKSSPQARPETQMQQNTVNSSVLWLGSRARARRPENQREKSKDRAASPACPAALGAKMRKNEPRLYPSDTYLKTVLFGWRGFLEGSLDDADQAPLKHHPGPTPDPDDVSHMA